MLLNPQKLVRHRGEFELLEQAAFGNAVAANKILHYLSSNNKDLRKIMLEALEDDADEKIWRKLLTCLAMHQWDGVQDCDRRVHAEASQRIDQSIVRAFTFDERPESQTLKENVLVEGLGSPEADSRHASAYLLGLRGHLDMIPLLQDVIETGSRKWQVRAIRALGMMGDPRCGAPLIQALAKDRGPLHEEARRALWRLGKQAEEAYLSAINHSDSHVRWHAARGLGEIGDPRALSLLADGLRDENEAVRWASARVLAQLGEISVPAILSALSTHQMTEPFRQAAFYALHSLNSRHLQVRLSPLFSVLKSQSTALQASAIAQHLLADWEKTE